MGGSKVAVLSSEVAGGLWVEGVGSKGVRNRKKTVVMEARRFVPDRQPRGRLVTWNETGIVVTTREAQDRPWKVSDR